MKESIAGYRCRRWKSANDTAQSMIGGCCTLNATDYDSLVGVHIVVKILHKVAEDFCSIV
jgi:hypothetical protein